MYVQVSSFFCSGIYFDTELKIHYFPPVSSVQSCNHLEQEKEDLQAAFEGVLQKMQEQHRSDLADLEERLKTFYSSEWEKVHRTYQEETDKCKAQMEQQVSEKHGFDSS